MPAYAVSYDLNRPGQAYTKLHEELKRSDAWWHYLDSTWLIVTAESADQVWNRISPHIDRGDRVLIIQVVNRKQGWLPAEAWDWINQHLAEAA